MQPHIALTLRELSLPQRELTLSIAQIRQGIPLNIIP